MISYVTTENYRTHGSVVPYLAMILIAFGIMFVIFGGMIDGAARRPMGPILSTVTIPAGIGMIIFGGMISKRAKRLEIARRSETNRFFAPVSPSAQQCSRCKSPSRNGASFCANCGQRL
jgi:hypothetical protein